ncbi:MAG: hypothetical protein MHM6MM_002786 [Cercozoa sp. M6MM]
MAIKVRRADGTELNTGVRRQCDSECSGGCGCSRCEQRREIPVDPSVPPELRKQLVDVALLQGDRGTCQRNSMATTAILGSVECRPRPDFARSGDFARCVRHGAVVHTFHFGSTFDEDAGNVLATVATEAMVPMDPLVTELQVPVLSCTPETLRSFGAALVGQQVPHNLEYVSSEDVPLNLLVSEVEIGEDYFTEWILGNAGCFLEWHAMPHFHAPRNGDAGGFLVLAQQRSDQDETQVTLALAAFRIPFRHGIYTLPGTWHSDSALIGLYSVVFAAEPCAGRTGNLRTADMMPLNVRFVEPRQDSNIDQH